MKDIQLQGHEARPSVWWDLAYTVEALHPDVQLTTFAVETDAHFTITGPMHTDRCARALTTWLDEGLTMPLAMSGVSVPFPSGITTDARIVQVATFAVMNQGCAVRTLPTSPTPSPPR